jgi:hypothetical protein
VWKPGKFELAYPWGPQACRGFVYAGLGLSLTFKASPKGRRKAQWKLHHLGTGTGLVDLHGPLEVVQSVATEIADAGDWTFDSMDGWRNQFPDGKERLIEIMERHPKVAKRPHGAAVDAKLLGVTRQIAMNRA